VKPKATYDPDADAIGVSFKPDSVDYMESEEVAPAWSWTTAPMGA
jgi:hypothetical protein